jgi:hypothetical protein
MARNHHRKSRADAFLWVLLWPATCGDHLGDYQHWINRDGLGLPADIRLALELTESERPKEEITMSHIGMPDEQVVLSAYTAERHAGVGSNGPAGG